MSDVPASSSHSVGWKRRAATFAGVVVTFHIVALAWILFRAPNLPAAFRYLRGLFLGPDRAPSTGPLQIVFLRDLVVVGAAALVLLLLIDLPQYATRDATTLLKRHVVVKALVVGLLLTWIFAVQGEPGGAFIYFQF